VLRVRPAVFDRDVATLEIAGFSEALLNRFDKARVGTRRYAAEDSDRWYCRLLRARRERPRCCRAAEQRVRAYSGLGWDITTPLREERRCASQQSCALMSQMGQERRIGAVRNISALPPRADVGADIAGQLDC
jgi:hypothetical protein